MAAAGVFVGVYLLLCIVILFASPFKFKFKPFLYKAWGIGTAATVLIAGAIAITSPDKSEDQKKPAPSKAASGPVSSHDSSSGNSSAQAQTRPAPPPKPAETKEQYIGSAKKIGTEKMPIFWKEFLKNPDKFRGERVSIIGKILDIQEENGATIIQAYLNQDFDSFIAVHDGSVPFYKEDLIVVYGEGAGSFEGQNAFGAEMKWPVIAAKYIEKYQR
jgi:hypothetical protein